MCVGVTVTILGVLPIPNSSDTRRRTRSEGCSQAPVTDIAGALGDTDAVVEKHYKTLGGQIRHSSPCVLELSFDVFNYLIPKHISFA